MRIAVVSAIFFLCGAAAFAAGAPASAPPKPQTMSQGPCMADVERFCSNVPFGKGRRLDCLARHSAQLTPVCRERVPRMQEMYKFGQEQLKATKAVLAKQNAATAKQKAAPPAPSAQKTKPK
jgi:hypothetical protein